MGCATPGVSQPIRRRLKRFSAVGQVRVFNANRVVRRQRFPRKQLPPGGVPQMSGIFAAVFFDVESVISFPHLLRQRAQARDFVLIHFEAAVGVFDEQPRVA